MIQNKIETYSDELVYSANVIHQLYINITFLRAEVDSIRDIDDELLCNGLIDDQINYLDKLLVESGERFKHLLARESSIEGLVFSSDYPFVESQPWIDELFPYFRNKDDDERILSAGGSAVYMSLSNARLYPDLCIESFVPDSFISVWFSIAAGCQSPGFIRKVKDNEWDAYGLER